MTATVWIVFIEREWDWQTHKEIVSVHETEASADVRCLLLGRGSSIESFEIET